MKRSVRARKIHMSQKNMHTAGPKSFARIREEMRNEDPNNEPPNLAKMFERTRRRTDGNRYVDTLDNNANTTNQLENYKPKDGHHTLYGRGVTNKLFKKVNGSDKADSEVEKNNLLVMRKELEKDHERKKAELEEDHERKKAELAEDHGRNKAELEAMIIDFENNRDKFFEEAVQKLLEKGYTLLKG